MNIKKSEVDKLIKEEFQKMMEKKKLSNRLSKINEELHKMDSEDASLNEVEAAGEEKVRSHGWAGEAGGDVKFKAKFEKKGSHMLENEEEVSALDETPMGEFEAKFAEIGKAIDAKLASEAGAETGSEEMGGESKDDDFEDVEVSDDDSKEPSLEGGSEESEEEDESFKVKEDVSPEQHLNPDDAMKTAGLEKVGVKGEVQESVEEPLEGHSVVQDADQDKVNDNMEKDKHVKESASKKGQVIAENKSSEKKNLFTEGLDAKKKTALLEEMNRMRKFAGLSKEEEE